MVSDRRRSSEESFIENHQDDEPQERTSSTALSPTPDVNQDVTKKAVGWKDLPRKGQLVILIMARLSEPLVQTSLQVRI